MEKQPQEHKNELVDKLDEIRNSGPENPEVANVGIQPSSDGILLEEFKDYRSLFRRAFDKRLNPERATSLMEMETSLKNNFNTYTAQLHNPHIHVKRQGWRNRYSDNLEEFNNLTAVVRALSTIMLEHDESKGDLVEIHGVLPLLLGSGLRKQVRGLKYWQIGTMMTQL